jgi:hypothetical protein
MNTFYAGNSAFLTCCASRDLLAVITLSGTPSSGGAAKSYTGIVKSIEHRGTGLPGREWCIRMQDAKVQP